VAPGTGLDAGEPARKPFSLRWIVLVIALLALTAGIARSQLAVGRVELVMQLSDSAREATIGVRNESDRPVQAVVRLEDWDRASDGANRWYTHGSRANAGSCSPALEIFPQALRLEAGAEQSLRVVLDRAKAPKNECWAAAVVETVQPMERDGQRIAYVVRTAVKIYVQPAHLTDDGEIEALRLVPDSGSVPADSSVEVLFSNTGTRHVVARGTLEVRRPDNTIVSRISLPTVYALPGARHAVRVRMPSLAPGSYAILATMDYGGPDIAAALLEHRAR
jgi:P pilus assembly chaperone PapD